MTALDDFLRQAVADCVGGTTIDVDDTLSGFAVAAHQYIDALEDLGHVIGHLDRAELDDTLAIILDVTADAAGVLRKIGGRG